MRPGVVHQQHGRAGQAGEGDRPGGVVVHQAPQLAVTVLHPPQQVALGGAALRGQHPARRREEAQDAVPLGGHPAPLLQRRAQRLLEVAVHRSEALDHGPGEVLHVHPVHLLPLRSRPPQGLPARPQLLVDVPQVGQGGAQAGRPPVRRGAPDQAGGFRAAPQESCALHLHQAQAVPCQQLQEAQLEGLLAFRTALEVEQEVGLGGRRLPGRGRPLQAGGGRCAGCAGCAVRAGCAGCAVLSCRSPSSLPRGAPARPPGGPGPGAGGPAQPKRPVM